MTGLTESDSVRSSTLDTPLDASASVFVFMLCEALFVGVKRLTVHASSHIFSNSPLSG